VTINLPPGADAQVVKDAVEEARRDLLAALEEARQEAADAAEAAADEQRPQIIRHKFGEPLMPLTMWFILFSLIVKITYKGKVQAEAKAAQATEVAESESLKRQVVEARMAAMQAQVEPHFLFNTLASIEHLIETDPARAGKMQRNLIALLRATMPTMREANAQGTRDLGRELAVIRPYLEILKVRMEERLQIEVRVADGLLSAEFPPMMLQSLVENAIKHGLEPKVDGGQLTVSAEIVHGKLAVTVADTGLGFGKAPTAGTGIGLSNIRERLALLYGNKASLSVTEPTGGGTSVTITVPYVAHLNSES
jgi:sensor histidine kinase YesM